MSKVNRRNFIKKAAVAGCTIISLSPKSAYSSEKYIPPKDRMGVLIDTTVCIGCRHCEYACKKAHNIPTDGLDTYSDRSIFKQARRPSEKSLTVVNEYKGDNLKTGKVDYKVQCMHCNHPACVSACIVGAMTKKESGAVVWDTNKCIGCRYCMVACPFQVPAFEYDKALKPDIKKCDFCFDRTSKGLLPACVEICPMEALTYGPRGELIKIARQRLENKPDTYAPVIYGENEIGGTSKMYLSSVEFTKLGFPKLGKNPPLGVTEAIQHGIFAYFIPPVALYALLGGLMWITKNREETE